MSGWEYPLGHDRSTAMGSGSAPAHVQIFAIIDGPLREGRGTTTVAGPPLPLGATAGAPATSTGDASGDEAGALLGDVGGVHSPSVAGEGLHLGLIGAGEDQHAGAGAGDDGG